MLGGGREEKWRSKLRTAKEVKCKMHVAKLTPCQPRRMGAHPLVLRCLFTFGSRCRAPSCALGLPGDSAGAVRTGSSALRAEAGQLSLLETAAMGTSWGAKWDTSWIFLVCIFLKFCGWGRLMNPANMGTSGACLGLHKGQPDESHSLCWQDPKPTTAA